MSDQLIVFFEIFLTTFCFRLFGHAFFTNLGLGPGSAVLAGISFALIAVFFVSVYRTPFSCPC
jgi:hypothetical protein